VQTLKEEQKETVDLDNCQLNLLTTAPAYI